MPTEIQYIIANYSHLPTELQYIIANYSHLLTDFQAVFLLSQGPGLMSGYRC